MSAIDVVQSLLIIGLMCHTLALKLQVKRLEGDERHYGGGRK